MSSAPPSPLSFPGDASDLPYYDFDMSKNGLPSQGASSAPSLVVFSDVPFPAASPVIRPGPSSSSKDRENFLFYGSEEDESDDEEAAQAVPVVIPRVARLYLPDEDLEEPVEALIEPSWPPTRPVQPVQPVPAEVPAPASGGMEPCNKFDFKWIQFPNPQTPPELRRETFILNKGPVEAYANPYDAFVAIWDRPIMEHILSETNKYSSQLCEAMMVHGISPNSRITKWVDTSVDELYTYFAIIIATGVVIKSRLEEYWSKSKDIFCTPEFSATMTYDRFCLLSKCLHFNDNALCTAERMGNSEAKLRKLLPILKHLNDKFASLYVLGRNIALDESLTKWTGRLNINQIIPNKAATKGIKTYEICESETGYLWRFEVEARQFTSNEQTGDPLSGKIPDLVLRLLHGLEHRGHTVWMDNYYNSPALARQLKLLGFDCAGTLRTTRKFVPAELNSLTARDLEVGQLCGCTAGDVDLIVWRDRRLIALISTYHGLTTAKCGDTIKPALVADYNMCMGGVDKKDQLLAMYPIERNRTSIWYKKFFKRLLNASTLNSYIMLKAFQKITHRQFRKTLVFQLMERHNKRQTLRSLKTVRHVPQLFERPGQGSANCKRRLRRKCIVCAKRTTSYCDGCEGKALCLPICFAQYHNK